MLASQGQLITFLCYFLGNILFISLAFDPCLLYLPVRGKCANALQLLYLRLKDY